MARTRFATTRPGDPDLRLQGRTYAIPFEDVWQGTLRLVRGRLKGWSLEHADDYEGVVQAAVRAWPKSLNGTVEIRIALDPQGQTRVDAHAATPAAFHDFGSNARRLARFFAALDRQAPRELERRRAESVVGQP